MDAGLIALAVAVLALAGALLSYARRDRAPSAVPGELAAVRDALAELRAANAQAVTDLRGELQRSLGETEQQVLTHAGSTQRTLTDLSRQLAALGEQSRRMGELAKDIGSLQELLRAPKLRGGFGELLLERVLADSLPATAYHLQYTYRDGSRVDAVVHFAGRLVPIDAKFPMESFHALGAATGEDDRRARRRAFAQQVKRHVDAVAKYVSPNDGTIDHVFLYVPSESVFYEAFVVNDAELDLRSHCAERRVIPASPNTLLAYLQVVSLGLRGMAMQERTRELFAGIRHAAIQLEKYREQHEQLGKHLEHAWKKYSESARGLDRASDAVAALVRAPVAEQPTLPLPPVERLLEASLPDEER